jgi:hypothetical protein
VGKIEPSLEERMQFTRVFPNSLGEFRVDPLCSELLDEPVVVDLAAHLPWRDDELFGHSGGVFGART